MVKRPPIPELEELSEGGRAVFDVLNGSSDLAAILVAAAYLDATVGSMLKRVLHCPRIASKLVEDPHGVLFASSARVDLACCLGLIPELIHSDLKLIAKIRNKAAYAHLEISFDDPPIPDLVESLSFVRTKFPHMKVLQVTPAPPRLLFVLTAAVLSQSLLLIAKGVKGLRVVTVKEAAVDSDT